MAYGAWWQDAFNMCWTLNDPQKKIMCFEDRAAEARKKGKFSEAQEYAAKAQEIRDQLRGTSSRSEGATLSYSPAPIQQGTIPAAPVPAPPPIPAEGSWVGPAVAVGAILALGGAAYAVFRKPSSVGSVPAPARANPRRRRKVHSRRRNRR